MSMYIGNNSIGTPTMHITSNLRSATELISSTYSDTIFHSDNIYLAYTNTGEVGSIIPDTSNTRRFTVHFSATIANSVYIGAPVLVLFKMIGSPYYQLGYSSVNSFYATYSTASAFSLYVITTTLQAHTYVEKVIAITFAEKSYDVGNILINSSGIFLNGTNVLVSDYVVSSSSLHNPLDTSLKISDSLFLQLYNTSTYWVSGIKVESSINTISRNSIYGYIPILSPDKKLTPISKYTISNSSHNNYGFVTASFSNPIIPNVNKVYMAIVKCYDDLGDTYVYFNCMLEGLSENRIIRHQDYPAPTVNMRIKLESNGSLTCEFNFRGFGVFPDMLNRRIINATGYIYEFN